MARMTQKDILNNSTFWLIFAICLLIFSAGLFVSKLTGFIAYRKAAQESAEAPEAVIEQVESEPLIELPMQRALASAPPAAPAPTEDDRENGWKTVDGKTFYINEDGEMLTGLRTVDGKLYYFSPDGARAESIGIDISSYNGAVNWEFVRENGVDFAIIRVGGRSWGKGKLYEDSFTMPNLLAAKEAGIKVGLYFYSTAINRQEAQEEARYAVKRLHGLRLDLPIFYDCEQSGDYPDGRSDLLSSAERTDIARAFCEAVEACGYEAGIYAGKLFFYQDLCYFALCDRPIWMANYTENWLPPEFRWDYDIWQGSSSAHVRGVCGQVDLNIVMNTIK